jgi:hypothetical protein
MLHGALSLAMNNAGKYWNLVLIFLTFGFILIDANERGDKMQLKKVLQPPPHHHHPAMQAPLKPLPGGHAPLPPILGITEGSEVLTVEKISMLVFWVVIPCVLVGRYRHFGGTYCLHLQGYRWMQYVHPECWLKMKAVCSSKTLVSYIQVHTVLQPTRPTLTVSQSVYVQIIPKENSLFQKHFFLWWENFECQNSWSVLLQHLQCRAVA